MASEIISMDGASLFLLWELSGNIDKASSYPLRTRSFLLPLRYCLLIIKN